jgi:hypothetical protein
LLTQDYRNLKKACKILCLIFISNYSLTAQDSTNTKSYKGFVELGTIISTSGETPFWMRSNQYGIVPFTAPSALFRAGLSSGYKKYTSKESKIKANKFDWGYGLEIAGNLSPKNNLDPDNRGPENKILFPEAYIKAKFGAFEIYAGRRREIVGLVDTALTSGSYIWSGNALPMPKIQISNPDYVPLGFTKGFISFKGSYAHGWFENNRTDVKNFYLHQKTLYLKMGKPNGKFHIYGGFNHQVQWGGELLYPDPNNFAGFNGKVGSRFSNYINAVTGKSLAVEGDTTQVGKNDSGNRGGNHLGTFDVGFGFKTKELSFLCYRQSIYDDGSLYFLNNITDGLYGFSITRKHLENKKIYLTKIVLEFLDTYSQGGEGNYINTIGRLRGKDNYFNSAVYTDGWVHYNKTIGTPFISNIIDVDVKDKSRYSFGIINSRVEMLFLGISLNAYKFRIDSHLSFCRNYGVYDSPFFTNLQNQFSSNVNVSFPTNLLKRSLIKTSISYDNKSIYNQGLGIYLGIQKYW